MKRIIAIVGARPQFIKHAAVDLAAKEKIDLITIHTGQHYDKNMSEIFFEQLKISKPDYLLNAGGLSHGKQTGKMMAEIEDILLQEKPDGVLVYGDTNSTLAGALAAAKLHIPVFHVEAGLRSYNKKMPEEVNRVLTDHISDLLFATSDVAVDNLAREGIKENVYNVGDVMYDMILIASKVLAQKPEPKEKYYYVTLHRPYNVDDGERLKKILRALNTLDLRAIFPIHPRTRNKMKDFGLNEDDFPNIRFVKPVSYFDNIYYLMHSSGLITDSGGMQKEAYWLKKKCVTIRTETEWVETVKLGWNTLVYDDLRRIKEIFSLSDPTAHSVLYCDGCAAELIVNRIIIENSEA